MWGGGLREKRAFYELCDELGLLVWQEFPFACLFLGAYPRDTAYLGQVEVECGAIVRQTAHHPSIAVWCGGNEFSRWRNRPLVSTLATVCKTYDGTRPFIPVSPSYNEGKDTHNWHVWHGNAPFQAYQAETARFLSEFGLQALPHFDTLQAMLPDPNTGWETHNADPIRLQRYSSLFKQKSQANLPSQVDIHSQPKIQNLQSKITASQQAQALALQTAIEHMRRRKGHTSGVCVWQFNEPWPAISWALVDYFGRPKLAYTQLSTWYNPLLISLNFPVGQRWQPGDIFTAEIWLTNDNIEEIGPCQVQIALDQQSVYQQQATVEANQSRRIGRLSLPLSVAPEQLDLKIIKQGRPLARNSYNLAWSDQSTGGFTHRFRRWVAEWVLR